MRFFCVFQAAAPLSQQKSLPPQFFFLSLSSHHITNPLESTLWCPWCCCCWWWFASAAAGA